ncbi:hypothetical protein [Methylobacterium marchantiae]|uniref:Uncharacterized protein n=1 Tax=Methylobacterium marchantiae TaxID=600331 RepID=A0ABW3X3T8_9HYPH|nr:hypothetical protein AIGOOFII_3918 [Methylobacterium marchantiae]
MIDVQPSCDDMVLFENADWHVIEDGLEHRETGYFVARDSLGRRSVDELWEWPLHLAEKSWCSPRLFREAFLMAIDLFGMDRDEALARSFIAGFGLRMGQGGVAGSDGFTKLSELVRPKSIPRRRPAASDMRSVSDMRSISHRGGAGWMEETETARSALS